MIKVGDTVTIIGGMSRRGDTVTVDQVSENECTIIDAKGNKGIYALTDVESQSMNGWIAISMYNTNETEAMQMAGGCLVRVTYTEDTATLAFVPASMIVDNQVVQKPTRLQISESQNILMSEVAAISKRPNELVFTLKCGKEITTTENIDEVLATFMQVSP